MDFFEGVPEKLYELKKRGFKLGILTNTFHPPSKKIVWFTTVAIDKVWDSYADSCELGIAKPDAAIICLPSTPKLLMRYAGHYHTGPRQRCRTPDHSHPPSREYILAMK